MKELMKHNIKEIPLELVVQVAPILDEVCVEGGIGKKEERYWVLNTDGHVSSNKELPIDIVNAITFLNAMLQWAKLNSFNSLMITNGTV